MESQHERGAARFGEFSEHITNLAKKVLEDVGDEQIKQIFTECLNAPKSTLTAPVKPLKDRKIKKIRDSLITTPLPYIKGDIEDVFEETGINEKFQLLSELQEKLKNRETPGWRPPSNPHRHMAAFRVAEKRELLNKYQVAVSMKTRQLKLLKDQIREKTVTSDLNRAVAELNDVKHQIKVIHGSNDRFKIAHEKTVEKILQKIGTSSFV